MNSETATEVEETQKTPQTSARNWETSEWFRRWLELIRRSNEPARA